MNNGPIAWLYSLQGMGVKLGLENIRTLLDLMNHPDESYSKVLIGGTNGKGSVCAMLEAVLRHHQVSAGMFTSPHLVRPNERIRVNGQDIGDAELERILEFVRTAIIRGLNGGDLDVHPSFFETITATALQAFSNHSVEVALLEVGLGGRLDATNATNADLSVVVTIGLDHTKNLGGTLELIAAEKGGIIKPGRPLVSGVEQEGPKQVLQCICLKRGAIFVDANSVAALQPGTDGNFSIITPRAVYDRLNLSLPGRHQMENAKVALVALEELAAVIGFEVRPEAVRSGLAEARWAGRLESVPGKPRLLLDAAHNAAGAAILADFLRSRNSKEKSILLFGCTREKDLSELLLPLAPYSSGLVASRPAIKRAMDPELIADFATTHFNPVELHPDPAEALEAARRMAGPHGEILVAGSLYLVGNVLAAMEGREAPGPVPM